MPIAHGGLERKTKIDTNVFCSLIGKGRGCFSGESVEICHRAELQGSCSVAISTCNCCSPFLYPTSSTGHGWRHSCSPDEPLVQPSAAKIVFLWHGLLWSLLKDKTTLHKWEGAVTFP